MKVSKSKKIFFNFIHFQFFHKEKQKEKKFQVEKRFGFLQKRSFECFHKVELLFVKNVFFSRSYLSVPFEIIFIIFSSFNRTKLEIFRLIRLNIASRLKKTEDSVLLT